MRTRIKDQSKARSDAWSDGVAHFLDLFGSFLFLILFNSVYIGCQLCIFWMLHVLSWYVLINMQVSVNPNFHKQLQETAEEGDEHPKPKKQSQFPSNYCTRGFYRQDEANMLYHFIFQDHQVPQLGHPKNARRCCLVFISALWLTGVCRAFLEFIVCLVSLVFVLHISPHLFRSLRMSAGCWQSQAHSGRPTLPGWRVWRRAKPQKLCNVAGQTKTKPEGRDVP